MSYEKFREAAEQGNVEEIRQLTTANPDLISTIRCTSPDRFPGEPFELAVKNGRLEAVKCLAELAWDRDPPQLRHPSGVGPSNGGVFWLNVIQPGFKIAVKINNSKSLITSSN